MPLVSFDALPGTARVWVFGSATPLDPPAEQALLAAADTFLGQWAAHGAPLTAGRDWREHRFLTIAVDTTQAHASGCSIDGLFRELRRLDGAVGSTFVSGGTIFYRGEDGTVHAAPRTDAERLATAGTLTPATVVFDLTVPTLADWRTRFETAAERSWHSALLPAGR
jgi:hypothetical protein